MPRKKAKKSKSKSSKKSTKKSNKVLKNIFGTIKTIIILLFKLIKFIVILPFKTFKFFNEKKKELKETKEEKDKEDKLNSIPANYELFEIVDAQQGSFNKWEDKLHKSTIGIILGARGKGKTALGMKILENVKATSKTKLYAMGFKKNDVPGWINVANEINEVKSNAFVLIDEGGILFSSRKSMTDANQVLSDLILVSRHKNLSILFISQNSSNLDINILRQADYLLLKPSSLLQKDFERKKIKELYEDLNFNQYDEYKGITYVYSDEFRGFVNNPLPSFWSLNISKSFK
jgi:hypothetical protein